MATGDIFLLDGLLKHFDSESQVFWEPIQEPRLGKSPCSLADGIVIWGGEGAGWGGSLVFILIEGFGRLWGKRSEMWTVMG